MIQGKYLAEEARSEYYSGKGFAYEHMRHVNNITIDKGTDMSFNVIFNAQRMSLKAVLIFFIEPYAAGAHDSEKYVFPDLTKIMATINGKSNMIYKQGLVSTDLWEEAKRFFVREKNKTEHMAVDHFFGSDRLVLVLDRNIHGSGIRLVNSADGIQLVIERTATGSGKLNCMIFEVANAQLNILQNQLDNVQK